MLNFFKQLFSKENNQEIQKEEIQKEEKKNKKTSCDDCPIKDKCNGGENKLCSLYKLPEIDEFKKTILLIDDNPGIVSFLEDDLNELFEKHNIKKDRFNILKITGNDAAINLISILNRKKSLKIDYAIIDLSYGAILKTLDGNLKFNGVDVFCNLKNKNPNLKFIFFTGNTLNPYLTSIKKMIETFKKCSDGKDINDFVLFKNQFTDEGRINFIFERLFKGEEND